MSQIVWVEKGWGADPNWEKTKKRLISKATKVGDDILSSTEERVLIQSKRYSGRIAKTYMNIAPWGLIYQSLSYEGNDDLMMIIAKSDKANQWLLGWPQPRRWRFLSMTPRDTTTMVGNYIGQDPVMNPPNDGVLKELSRVDFDIWTPFCFYVEDGKMPYLQAYRTLSEACQYTTPMIVRQKLATSFVPSPTRDDWKAYLVAVREALELWKKSPWAKTNVDQRYKFDVQMSVRDVLRNMKKATEKEEK